VRVRVRVCVNTRKLRECIPYDEYTLDKDDSCFAGDCGPSQRRDRMQGNLHMILCAQLLLVSFLLATSWAEVSFEETAMRKTVTSRPRLIWYRASVDKQQMPSLITYSRCATS